VEYYRQRKAHQQELSGNHTSSHLLAKQEELEKEMINFALRSISFILLYLFNMPNLATVGLRLPEGVLQTFIALGRVRTRESLVQWQAR
jgi:hypothetical protein